MAMLDGCGGGAARSAMPNAGGSIRSDDTALVKLNLIVPKKLSPSSGRTTSYVSPATQSLTITVTAASGVVQPSITVPCTTSCTASFHAPVGHDVFALRLTDTRNQTGNALSLTDHNPVTILPDVVNTIALTADPVVKNVAVLVGTTPASTASTNGGTAVDVPVTVRATDADGNVIIGPGKYVDASGNPLTLALSVANDRTGGSGSVSLAGATVLTSPNAAATVAHYDGNPLNSGTISVNSTSASVTVAPGTLAIAPAVSAEYTVPTANSSPSGITIGPDGNVWFSEISGNKIARVVDPGVFQEYAVPTPGAAVRKLTAGADGNIWFTEYGGGQFGRLTLSGSFTEFPIVSMFSPQPQGITPGADGNIWFTEAANRIIARINSSGTITEYPIPGAGYAVGLTRSADGNLWFATAYQNQIGRITPASVFTIYPVPTPASMPRELTAGADGNIWFTESNANKIGRVTPAGTFTEFTIPTANSGPSGITAGVDGSLWFVESTANQIGRVTTDGRFTEYPIPTASAGASFIVTATDGSVWFTESSANKIGKLVF